MRRPVSTLKDHSGKYIHNYELKKAEVALRAALSTPNPKLLLLKAERRKYDSFDHAAVLHAEQERYMVRLTRRPGSAPHELGLLSPKPKLAAPAPLKPPDNLGGLMKAMAVSNARAKWKKKTAESKGGAERTMSFVGLKATEDVPPHFEAEAVSFDDRHRRCKSAAESAIALATRDPRPYAIHDPRNHAFKLAARELYSNRFTATPSDSVKATSNQREGNSSARGWNAFEGASHMPRSSRPNPKWTIEKSIFLPRTKQSDSRSFYDTPPCCKRALEKDFERAIAAGLGARIAQHNEEHGSPRVRTGGHVPSKSDLSELSSALWDHHEIFYGLFTYYCAIHDSTDDLFTISSVAFAAFLSDFRLAESAKSAYCSPQILNTLFASVAVQDDWSVMSVNSAMTVKADQLDQRLERSQFLQVLVLIAMAKYCRPKTTTCVKEAATCLRHLMVEVITPKVTKSAASIRAYTPNIFRREVLYTQGIDRVFKRNEPSLRRLFTVACHLDESDNLTMMSYATWTAFLRLFRLRPQDLTEDEALKAFIGSRMLVVDELEPASKTKRAHLTFEDWLEALVRIAPLKAFPTDEEIAAAALESNAADNAAEYLLRLEKEDPAILAELKAEHARSPGRVPLVTCVRNLCHWLIAIAQGGGAAGALGQSEDLRDLTEVEALRGLARMSGSKRLYKMLKHMPTAAKASLRWKSTRMLSSLLDEV